MVRKALVKYAIAACVALAGCAGERRAVEPDESITVRMGPAPGQPGATLVECYATPRAIENQEAMERQRVAAMKRALQETSPQAEVYVRFYYEHLDRARKNGPMLRSGYWPQGHYYYCYPIEGAELAQLRRALAQLEAVPLQGRPQSIIRRDAEDRAPNDFSFAYLELRPAGRSALSPGISDPRKSIVKKSQLSAAMKQMSMNEFYYSLPDAARESLLALPTLRKAYAALKKYRSTPAPFFTSVEEADHGRTAEAVRTQLPGMTEAELTLQMRYPKLAAEGDTALLLPPVVTLPRYEAKIQLSAGELAQLREILSRLVAVPMRYMVPFTAAPRSPAEVPAELHLELRLGGGESIRLGDIGHSIARHSERRSIAGRKYGDCVCWELPDADYEALMALPSVRRALEWSRQYKEEPAAFFTELRR